MLAAAVFSAGLTAAAVALAIAYMPYVARVLRGALHCGNVVSPTSRPSKCRVRGTSICLRHIVPNILPLIVAQATILFGWAMVDLVRSPSWASGVPAASPELGRHDLRESAGILRGYPLPALAAGLCIVGVVIAFNVLGERLFEQAQAVRR